MKNIGRLQSFCFWLLLSLGIPAAEAANPKGSPVTAKSKPTSAKPTGAPSKLPATVKAIERSASGLTRQQLWGLACPALLSEINSLRHDYLTGFAPGELTPEYAREDLELLRVQWRISNRMELIERLSWIQTEGHRAGFETLGKEVTESSPRRSANKSFSIGVKDNNPTGDKEVANKISVVEHNYKQLGHKGLLAWDFCRYIFLVRDGVRYGWLAEGEAWPRIFAAARILQQNFDSWEDLGRNYLIGRRYWSRRETDESGAEFEALYKKLTTDPRSPWRTLPWNLPLDVK